MKDALVFKRIATVELNSPVSESVDELEWTGPTAGFEAMAERIGGPQLVERAAKITAK